MTVVRVHALSISLDGFVAGPDQSVEHPVGRGGESLHRWIFETRTGRAMIGRPGGSEGPDDDLVAAGFAGIGATVMGRNMFGPVRGPWATSDWRGWWGATPPFHHPVFVVTHHEREAIEMDGGTTFHFVTGGLEEALTLARAAAGPLDVRLGGGASLVRQGLAARLVDRLHLALVPELLGTGETLFGEPGLARDYRCVAHAAGERVTHLHLQLAD